MSYRIKRIAHPRFKSLRLSISQDGQVLLTHPKYINKRYINDFLTIKKPWLEEKLKNIKIKPDNYFSNKEKARKILTKKVEYFNSFYGFLYNRIAIRNSKGRWGSCSSKKNLNFNYRLIFLPEELMDYVIVHELCHLQELNHQKPFWQLVAKVKPNYKLLKKKLKSFEI